MPHYMLLNENPAQTWLNILFSLPFCHKYMCLLLYGYYKIWIHALLIWVVNDLQNSFPIYQIHQNGDVHIIWCQVIGFIVIWNMIGALIQNKMTLGSFY